MKKTTLYIVLLIAVLLTASCTRNHGDIGIWFGTWHVEQITADGTRVNVEGDYFFQFQNSFPDPTIYYIVMPGLEAHNQFTVSTTSSSDVTFTKTSDDGIAYSYHLKKQP